MLDFFARPGRASFIVGGQWGSEAKGAAAAYLAHWQNINQLEVAGRTFDIATTNAGAQAGHTSTHEGKTTVVFHLPTYSLYRPCLTYLNAGSIIDPAVLFKELEANPQILRHGFAIHPNAAIITDDCREAEGRETSMQTQIASTRKGVGQALARKVLRSGLTAGNYFRNSALESNIRRVDLNAEMGSHGKSVLVEIPQGHSLSVDGPFYPHTTSRNCTVAAGMSDAGIHPTFYHKSMLVVRTYPIRVGNIYDNGDNPQQIGFSGYCFPDQKETSWGALGVKPEITTVTKRVRRVFTWSDEQVAQSIAQTRPDVIYLSFCDYLGSLDHVKAMVRKIDTLSYQYGRVDPTILTGWGPTTEDVKNGEEFR